MVSRLGRMSSKISLENNVDVFSIPHQFHSTNKVFKIVTKLLGFTHLYLNIDTWILTIDKVIKLETTFPEISPLKYVYPHVFSKSWKWLTKMQSSCWYFGDSDEHCFVSSGHSMLNYNLYCSSVYHRGPGHEQWHYMGCCTVNILPLECEGLNEGFDFECFSVFEKPCLHFMV